MAHFFRKIDVNISNVQSVQPVQPQDTLLNLDDFVSIQRDGSYVRGYRTSTGKLEDIAICNTNEGADYVLDCILKKEYLDKVRFDLIDSGKEPYP